MIAHVAAIAVSELRIALRNRWMVTATLTTKGQITIPKAVREALRLRAGDRVEFVVKGGTEATLRPITKSVDEVFGKLHNPDQPSRTLEEMKDAVARRLRTRNG